MLEPRSQYGLGLIYQTPYNNGVLTFAGFWIAGALIVNGTAFQQDSPEQNCVDDENNMNDNQA